jgi:DNA-binding transcriptional ArsR family regulator
MADHTESSGIADDDDDGDDAVTKSVPDYELADRLDLNADQLKLVLEPTRLRIIDLLSERAATTSQLADVMKKPKGTIGHHTKALEDAGLIRVVRTAKVRAMEERYYGRAARLFIMGKYDDAGVSLGAALDVSYQELRTAASPPYDESEAHLASARYARIPRERAQEWSGRFSALLDEFAAQERDGDTTYGVMIGLFATDRKGFS